MPLTHQELVALRLQCVPPVMRLAGSRSTDEEHHLARIRRGGTFAEQASSIDSEGGRFGRSCVRCSVSRVVA